MPEILNQIHNLGVGELLLSNMSRDGTRLGYDLSLVHMVSHQLNIPVVMMGGARNVEDFKFAIDAGASAVGAGSLFVFQNNLTSSILINYPSRKELESLFYEK